ncbi:MAG: tRNA (guanine-N1)-methyltransferase [Flavobacteriaceae bacterium]
MKQFFFFLATLFIGLSSSFSQEEENKLSLTNSTVNEKFDYVLTKSNNYQEFKVVKKTWLYTLKKQVIDSVIKQKSEINTLTKTIETQKNNTISLEAKIVELNDTITQISTDKENISFLGADLKKSDFKNLFWAIIAILTILLAFFIYQFKNSNSVTQSIKTQLADIEKEFDEHRKIALEREQKVMRKLQDELNKNRH